MGWACAEVLAWVETPCLHQEVSFPDHIPAASDETNPEAGAGQALVNIPRLEKWEPRSQINFSTKFGWRHQIYRRVKVKRRELKKVGGILMTSPATGMWTWSSCSSSFQSLYGFFRLLSWQISTVTAVVNVSFNMLIYYN